MKQYAQKLFLASLVLAFMASIGNAYASESAGTLSTAPDSSQSDTQAMNPNAPTPAPDNSMVGTVTGGTPVAEAQDEYGDTESASAFSGDSNNTWIWITIPVILLAGALIYVFSRPSPR